VFNDGLRVRQEAYEAGLPYITDAELSALLTAGKASPERAWLAEVSAVILQQSLADLNTAYRNFFASVTGRRKGPELALPRFRSRKDRRQAIRFTANARFAVTSAGKLRLPKIGDVPVRQSRRCRLSRMAVRSGRPADRADDFVIAVNEIAARSRSPPACRACARTRLSAPRAQQGGVVGAGAEGCLQAGDEGVEAGGEPLVAVVGPGVCAEGG
jgi:hypothetical protein